MTDKPTSPWPNGCRGAVSLSFDDGSPSQLGIAVPVLDACGLHGTFYLNPAGDDWRVNLAPWREAGLRGHELGNHTVSHICANNLWNRDDYRGLEVMTLDEVAGDVDEAERRLLELLPGQTTRTFCYPCYQTDVGVGATRKSYIPLIAERFPAARGLGELANAPRYADMHYLASFPIGGWMSGADLCKFAQIALDGRWVILTLHGFQRGQAGSFTPGGPWHMPPVTEDNMRILCGFLAAERERIWTATVVEAAATVSAWRKTL